MTDKTRVEGTDIELYNISAWTRSTIADGKWLNANTIQPLEDNEYILASAIDRVSGSVVNVSAAIDVIKAQSDVVDVVGSYQDLVDYDLPLTDNDIVKVLHDSSHDRAQSYYRMEGGEPGYYDWSYVGSIDIQSDWTQTNSAFDSYIKHKPEEIQLVAGTNVEIYENPDGDLVISALDTDPVQSDWTETDSSDPSYILHKPDIVYFNRLGGSSSTPREDNSVIKIQFDSGQTALSSGLYLCLSHEDKYDIIGVNFNKSDSSSPMDHCRVVEMSTVNDTSKLLFKYDATNCVVYIGTRDTSNLASGYAMFHKYSTATMSWSLVPENDSGFQNALETDPLTYDWHNIVEGTTTATRDTLTLRKDSNNDTFLSAGDSSNYGDVYIRPRGSNQESLQTKINGSDGSLTVKRFKKIGTIFTLNSTEDAPTVPNNNTIRIDYLRSNNMNNSTIEIDYSYNNNPYKIQIAANQSSIGITFFGARILCADNTTSVNLPEIYYLNDPNSTVDSIYLSFSISRAYQVGYTIVGNGAEFCDVTRISMAQDSPPSGAVSVDYRNPLSSSMGGTGRSDGNIDSVRHITANAGEYIAFKIKGTKNHRSSSIILCGSNNQYPFIVNIGFSFLQDPGSGESKGFNYNPRLHIIECNNCDMTVSGGNKYIPTVYYKYDSTEEAGYIYCQWVNLVRLTAIINSHTPSEYTVSKTTSIPGDATQADNGHAIPHMGGWGTAIGNETIPTYINKSGEIVACTGNGVLELYNQTNREITASELGSSQYIIHRHGSVSETQKITIDAANMIDHKPYYITGSAYNDTTRSWQTNFIIKSTDISIADSWCNGNSIYSITNVNDVIASDPKYKCVILDKSAKRVYVLGY